MLNTHAQPPTSHAPTKRSAAAPPATRGSGRDGGGGRGGGGGGEGATRSVDERDGRDRRGAGLGRANDGGEGAPGVRAGDRRPHPRANIIACDDEIRRKVTSPTLEARKARARG